MPIRITGMNSGLDTESIISELVKAKSEKKDKLVKAQTKLQWKQDAWKELNSKVYNLYSKTLSNMRMKSDYLKKTTKSSSNAATVITGTNAVNGVQTLKINSLAKSGYLTGAELMVKDANGKNVGATTATHLKDLGITGKNSFTVKVGDNETEITFNGESTINDVLTQLKKADINVNFDDKNHRFFISAKSTGAGSDFELSGDGLKALGISALSAEERKNYESFCTYNEGTGKYEVNAIYNVDPGLTGEEKTKAEALYKEAVDAAAKLNAASQGATRIYGTDAEIELNGATFKSNTNTFEINGLTITANSETAENEVITLTTEDDTEGIYDMIKNFFKEYNTLINEMDKLYNADSSKGYEPLTDEEKESMSEKDIEKWEEKIKDSLLRRDSTLSKVTSAMKEVMSQGVKMVVRNADGSETDTWLTDASGKAYGHLYLSDFGIGTLGYFDSKENEKNAYHIDGDPDDASTMTKADKLKTAIANDPNKVVEFFSQLSKNLYTKLGDMMKKTDYSSSFTLYDDISMKEEYNDYKDKISKQEEKIADFEDRYYKKFSAMETALAKMQAKESAISGLLGM